MIKKCLYGMCLSSGKGIKGYFKKNRYGFDALKNTK
jgi:hypothetical protein